LIFIFNIFVLKNGHPVPRCLPYIREHKCNSCFYLLRSMDIKMLLYICLSLRLSFCICMHMEIYGGSSIRCWTQFYLDRGVMGFRAGCPRMCHFSIWIIFSWRQFRLKKRILTPPPSTLTAWKNLGRNLVPGRQLFPKIIFFFDLKKVFCAWHGKCLFINISSSCELSSFPLKA